MSKDKITIKNMELSGRIIMPPIATYKCDDFGIITDDVCKYYEERAKNSNISLIIIEHNYVSLQGKVNKKQMSIADDTCIEGHKKLVNSIHKNGVKVVLQLNHAGSATSTKITGMAVVAPSPIDHPGIKNDGKIEELSYEQIKNIINDFKLAALRAKKAGYDGIEIHSAHGYLLNQFYSPLTNKRNDNYGGELKNRLLIHREIIREIRSALGNDYPIFLRLGASDYMNDGNTISDGVEAAKLLEAEGIDLFDISGGMCRYTRNDCSNIGYFQDASKAIKKEVSSPVILTGGITTLKEVEDLLKANVSDLIGIGRELLKNPRWEM